MTEYYSVHLSRIGPNPVEKSPTKLLTFTSTRPRPTPPLPIAGRTPSPTELRRRWQGPRARPQLPAAPAFPPTPEAESNLHQPARVDDGSILITCTSTGSAAELN
jgi:hypothetical protein